MFVAFSLSANRTDERLAPMANDKRNDHEAMRRRANGGAHYPTAREAYEARKHARIMRPKKR